MINKQRR